MACSNAALAPLVIPYGNVTLAGNTIGLQRGLRIELGNPPQTLSFQPSLIDDSLAITDPARCVNGNSNTTCAATWGGLYENADSTTYYPVSAQSWNGTHDTPDGREPTAWFNDEIRFADKSIFGYPITHYQPNIYSNILGVNENSSFLSLAVASNLAPTISFGLWAGSTASNNEADGSLVIGGYDKARVSGDFTIFNATSGCLGCAYVKSIQYKAPDGTNTELTNDLETPLAVSLSPEILDMELPPAAMDKFVETTGALPAHEIHKWIWPVGTKLGTVTIGFYNGYEVKIPGEELWQPFTGYDASGKFTVLNDSITISRLVNRTDGLKPNFGFPFFASTYMTFHPKENYFALAEPVRDANVNPSIESFCKPNGQPNNETSPSNDASSSHGVNYIAGAIAGGVVGGVAGLAFLGVLIWLFVRHKKRNLAATAGATSNPSEGNDSHIKDHLLQEGSYSSVPSSAVPPELPQYTKYQAFKPPSEMASTEVRPELAAPSQAMRHEMP